MEPAAMRKVVVAAKIENLGNLYDVQKGLLPDDQVRRVEVHDAVVDTKVQRLIGNPEHGGEWGIDAF